MKVLFRIALWWWFNWSKVYRSWFEPATERDLKPVESLDELVQRFEKTKWKADGLRQLGDALGTPEYFQYLLEVDKVPKNGHDCDDYASYAEKVIELSLALGNLSDEVVKVGGCMSASWWKKWFWKFKRPAGHAVCVLHMSDGSYAHIGNWGLHKGFASLESVARDIINKREPLGWALWSYPSKLIHYTTGIV